MRVIFAAAMIALLAGPACAQSQLKGQTPGPPPGAPKSNQEIQNERAAEKAYKNSLQNIPDKAPADPWGGARNLDAPKTAAKTTTAKTPAASKPQVNTGSTAN
jgi:hypothetical protein